MFHPLSPRLADFTDEELQKKHTELMAKLNQSFRFGGSVTQQIQLLLNDYQAELSRRQAAQLEELTKASAEFKNIIDIQ